MADDDQQRSRRGVPNKMREMVEKNISQTKKAYEDYVTHSEKMMGALESSTERAWLDAREVNRKLAGFADANTKAGFDYAERFINAKDAKEISALQQQYLKETTERLTQQMREINDIAASAAREAAAAVKPNG